MERKMAKKEKDYDEKKQNFENAQKTIASFLDDYGNVELAGVTETSDGKRHFVFRPALATIDPEDQSGLSKLPAETKKRVLASTIYRETLRRSQLDLAQPDVVNEAPHKLYEKMRSYYRSKDVFGSYIDTLVNLAIAGFENDCEDLSIKEFYDNWCEDVDLVQVLEWIFQEFYTTGFVRTYKVLGKYEPQINRLKLYEGPKSTNAPKRTSGQSKEDYLSLKVFWDVGEIAPKQPEESDIEYAARKKVWSKGFVPLAYTVLNPTEIEIKGSIMFNQTRVTMPPSDEMIELIKKEDTEGPLTEAEKKLLDNIPPEIKSAIRNNKEIELDPEFVGEVDYRRMPYERYSIPKGARAIESLEYKEALREADYSTIDGIVSEVLVITIGDKDNPVTSSADLKKVADLFNTPQKAFNVVWNHTLRVERVTADNINQIFGVQKFEQVERDISGSFGIPRGLLDGIMYGEFNKDSIALAVQAVISELVYARRQVERWIYKEYKQIAEAFGFERYPSVRWNTMILKDELAYKTLIQGLVDRRIISYDTAFKLLSFDPEYEKSMLTSEKERVINGDFGLHGSPYQQKGGGIQPVQKTPTGTPSEGRPKNSPSPKTPVKPTPTNQLKQKVKKAASLKFIEETTLEELIAMERLLAVAKAKKEQELASFLLEEEDSLEDNNND